MGFCQLARPASLLVSDGCAVPSPRGSRLRAVGGGWRERCRSAPGVEARVSVLVFFDANLCQGDTSPRSWARHRPEPRAIRRKYRGVNRIPPAQSAPWTSAMVSGIKVIDVSATKLFHSRLGDIGGRLRRSQNALWLGCSLFILEQ
jgi:hypothetical protein